jgi:hypothetical protein
MSSRDHYARPVHVTAATNVSGTPCTLFGLNINSEAAAQTATIYNDGTGGTTNPVAVIKLDSRLSFAFGTDGMYLDHGCNIVVSGGTPDLTAVIG